ncbi:MULTISPECIES: hypothetical protein [unclassified Janthinobacterium]|nr:MULTISPECIES: hypothetical protein [unclassified Janthinobacterium]
MDNTTAAARKNALWQAIPAPTSSKIMPFKQAHADMPPGKCD